VHIALGLGMWVVALLALKARGGFLASHRRRLWCVALSFVAVPTTIAVLHRFSAMHCPWDVVDFGGTAPYFDLLTAPPPGVSRGRCFPASFVTSASWMLSFAWLWFPERRRLSVAIGLVVLAWAFGLGWVQQMRGAHFLSHTLWSLWVGWLVVLVAHFATGAWREAVAPSMALGRSRERANDEPHIQRHGDLT
jgi:membrane-associated PAP2 superfamily phosphatase